MASRRLLLAGLALLVVAGVLPGRAVAWQAPPPPVAPPDGGSLPPIECIEAVRRARIAAETGDHATARGEIEAALPRPGCAMPALAAALPMLRAGVYAPHEVTALRARLAGLLADPATALPEGVLRHLVLLPAERADEEPLLAALVQRLARLDQAASPARPRELAEVLEAVAHLQERHGRTAEARSTLHRLLALAPDEALRWRVVLLDVRLGEWASAAGLLAGMVDAPEAPRHLRELYVVALAHLGRHEEMLRELERLEPEPRAARSGGAKEGAELPRDRTLDVVLTAAWALRDAGRDSEAEATFRRVLALDPESQEARLALLHLYGTAEERAAHAAVVAARQREETDPVALFEEGSDLLGAGDLQAAHDLLARAAPGLAGTDYGEAAWFNLGTAAFRLERWSEALEALDRAIAVNPGRAESHYRRGVALYRLERWSDAAEALRRTLEIEPGRRDAHAFLALAYAELGDAAAAARHRELSGQAPGG